MKDGSALLESYFVFVQCLVCRVGTPCYLKS